MKKILLLILFCMALATPTLAAPISMAPAMAPAPVKAPAVVVMGVAPMDAPAGAMGPGAWEWKPTPVATAAPPMAAVAMAPDIAGASVDPKPAPAKVELGKAPEKPKTDWGALITQILLGLAAIVFTVLKAVDKMQWTKDARAQLVFKYLNLGFDAVEGLVTKSKNKVDDKLLEFFRTVNGLLKESGQPELTDEEKKAAAEFAKAKALAIKMPK